MGCGGADFLGGTVLVELDVMEHESEVFFSDEGWIGSGEIGFIFDEFETDGEFAATEVGLLKGLPFAGTALKHV